MPLRRPILLALPLLLGAVACGTAEESADDFGDDSHTAESDLTVAERTALCGKVAPARPWTAAEGDRLLQEVVARFTALKSENDALIASRGVGRFLGVRTAIAKKIDAGDFAGAAADLAPYIKKDAKGVPVASANAIARELAGTSCIGRAYAILREAYAAIGRSSEWDAIEKCGRAWDSDGLHVQDALIRDGWKSPSLGFVTDRAKLPGTADERALHQGLVSSAGKKYFGVPVAPNLLADFLPTPGSTTAKKDAALLALGKSKFLAFGTFRAAFHVPLVVPASVVPASLAPAGSAGVAWKAAKDRGEPFIFESHSLRQPWDPTNFEVRPMTAAIQETMNGTVIYATGTLLFAPFSAEVRP